MKLYEGLFILNTAGKEEGIKEAIDKISSEIESAGAKVETVQKMDRKQFTRVADKKHSAGFYVNIIFRGAPAALAACNASARQRGFVTCCAQKSAFVGSRPAISMA